MAKHPPSSIGAATDASTALETLPLRPLPQVQELELTAGNVASSTQCRTVVDTVRLEGGKVGLLVMQCVAPEGGGGVRSLVARAYLKAVLDQPFQNAVTTTMLKPKARRFSMIPR